MFLLYAGARFIREKEEQVYRDYIADQVWANAQGKYLPSRFRDRLTPPEKKSAEEIISDVTEKAGLVIVDGLT